MLDVSFCCLRGLIFEFPKVPVKAGKLIRFCGLVVELTNVYAGGCNMSSCYG